HAAAEWPLPASGTGRPLKHPDGGAGSARNRTIIGPRAGGPLSRPAKQQIADSYGKTIPDLIAPGLQVLFSRINPSLHSAAVGHHVARPGNRFWPALHQGGFMGRVLLPSEGEELLRLGYGITNVVDRATGAADELAAEELTAGGRALERKVRKYRPRVVTFLG